MMGYTLENAPLISAKASVNRGGVCFGSLGRLNKVTGMTVYESMALTRSTVLVTEDWSSVEPSILSGILESSSFWYWEISSPFLLIVEAAMATL